MLLRILGTILLLTTVTFAQWVQLNREKASGKFLEIQFIDTQTGYAITDANEFLKTTDFGNSWKITTPANEQQFSTMEFVNETHGWIGCDSAIVYRTTDGGENWTELTTPGDYLITDLDFCDENNGYAFEMLKLMKTTDGGENWTVVLTHPSHEGNVYAFSVDTVFANRESDIKKSCDGGATWQNNYEPDGFYGITSLYFFNSEIGLSGRAKSHGDFRVINTSDGGDTWSSESSNYHRVKMDHFSSVNTRWRLTEYFPDSESILSLSTDGGTSYSSILSALNNSFEQFSCFYPVTDSICVVGTENGNLFYTQDQGTSWQQMSILVDVKDEQNLTADEYSLSQNYPNPFNPSTTISYTLKNSANVKLTVYNQLGEVVKVLVSEFKTAGSHSINFDASGLASGLYFYSVTTNKFTQTKKMVLLK